MDKRETQAALRILVAVARADGRVSPEEASAFEIEGGGAGAFVSLGDVDVEAEARRIATPDGRRATMDAAVAMATVDGHCSDDERALLKRIGRAFGIENVDPAISKWLDTLGPARDELETVERDFLHALAKSNDGVSDALYQSLVSEMRARRTEILSRALTG
jgi:tellurite resistance protein